MDGTFGRLQQAVTTLVRDSRLAIRVVTAGCAAVLFLGVTGTSSALPPNYYGIAGVSASVLNQSYLTGIGERLYSAQLALNCYTCNNLLDDDMWISDDNSNSNWIEGGLVVGTVCQQSDDHSSGNGTCTGSSGTYKIPRFFWADQRPTGGFNAHIDVADTPSLPGYWDDSITYQGSDSWAIQIGPHFSGSSNANTMIATVLQTGTEESSQSGNACNGQSELSYYGASGGYHNGWPGLTVLEINEPPWVTVDSSTDVHDWSPTGNTFCY
jgi:hypothetical protein